MSKPKMIFLVAQYFKKPKPHVNTSQKGWMDNPENVRFDEQVAISRGLRSKDMHAQVILDLSNKRVEKNAFNDKDFDEIFKYFFANYSEYIIRVMTELDPEYLEQMVNELEKEIEQIEANGIQDATINAETQAQ
jgi:hypothetical protein